MISALWFRHFPLPYHENASLAASAAEAAGNQGKFVEMKTILFENQETWGSLEKAEFETWLTEQRPPSNWMRPSLQQISKTRHLTDKIQDSFNKGVSGRGYRNAIRCDQRKPVPGQFGCPEYAGLRRIFQSKV